MSLNKAVLALFTILALLFFLGDDVKKFGDYEMESTTGWSSTVPFNYFLIKDGHVYSYLVNDYYVLGESVYFTEIDGDLMSNFCYHDKDLKLSIIDLKTGELIRFVRVDDYMGIYSKISNIALRDKRWLSLDSNKCILKDQ